jgi:hypothetical protein
MTTEVIYSMHNDTSLRPRGFGPGYINFLFVLIQKLKREVEAVSLNVTPQGVPSGLQVIQRKILIVYTTGGNFVPHQAKAPGDVVWCPMDFAVDPCREPQKIHNCVSLRIQSRLRICGQVWGPPPGRHNGDGHHVQEKGGAHCLHQRILHRYDSWSLSGHSNPASLS